MNKLNIGYDHYEERTNFYNGAPHKDSDWLEYREYYGLDITEVDVNTCGDFYIFPVNALWAKFELFEEKTFFGNYLSEKVIKDLQSDKCLLHINALKLSLTMKIKCPEMYQLLLCQIPPPSPV